MKIGMLMIATFPLVAALTDCARMNDNAYAPVTGLSTCTLIVNGDGFRNETIIINGAKGVGNNIGFYQARGNSTDLEVSDSKVTDGDADNDVQISFSGKTTGLIPINTGTSSDNKNFLTFALKKGGNTGNYYSYGKAAGANISIVRYGNVGDYIEGTFKGQMNNLLSRAVITVSGRFKIARIPDQN